MIRATIAAIACIVAPVLLVAAGMLLWANRTVLDSGHVAQEVDAALADPEVTAALVDAVAAELPPDPVVQAAARPTIERVIATPLFRNAMSNAVRAAHVTLVDGDEPEIVLDLTSYLDELQQEVATIDPAAAQAIPTTTSIRLAIADRTDLPAVWRATAAMRRIPVALLVLGISLGALGLVLARRRGRWLGIAALIGGLLAIGIWLLTSFATDGAVDAIADPDLRIVGDDVAGRLTSGLAAQSLVIAAIAGVAILIALVISRLEPEDF